MEAKAMACEGWLQASDTLVINLDAYASIHITRDTPDNPALVLKSRTGDESLDLYLEGAEAFVVRMHVRRYCARGDAEYR